MLPADSEALHATMARERALWIVKPIASSCGRGISIIQSAHHLPQEDVVVSRYISNPLLIDGFKFDLRLYVAVTSFEPLRCYMFEEGLARFSTERYQVNPGGAALKNLFMHLTNYSINKHSAHFVNNTDASTDDHGNKWSLSALRRCLSRNGVNVDSLFQRIDSLIVRTLIGVEPSVTAACRRYCTHRNCAFQLFGFDVLIDDTLKPWLLEVNLAPSLAAESPLDLKVKSRMLSQLLTLANLTPYDREAHRVERRRRDKMRYARRDATVTLCLALNLALNPALKLTHQIRAARAWRAGDEAGVPGALIRPFDGDVGRGAPCGRRDGCRARQGGRLPPAVPECTRPRAPPCVGARAAAQHAARRCASSAAARGAQRRSQRPRCDRCAADG